MLLYAFTMHPSLKYNSFFSEKVFTNEKLDGILLSTNSKGAVDIISTAPLSF